MLALNEVELRQTRFYQEVSAEGRQEGKQEGLQEGLQEGKQEEAAKLLLLLIDTKFGIVNTNIQTKVNQASIETIEKWTTQIFQAETPEALLDS